MSVPKNMSRTPAHSTRRNKRVIQLKKVLQKSDYDRIKVKKKNGQPHAFTTAQLVDLIDRIANAQPAPDTTPDTAPNNAAESARHRQHELAHKRQELIERISTNPPPPPAPIARKVPLDKLPRIDFNDRAAILRSKLNSVLTRLRGFNKVGNTGLFNNTNSNHVRSFQRGFSDLNRLVENLDVGVKHLKETEWRSLNWGFTTIRQVSFKGIRENFTYMLKRLAEIFDDYFLFISIDKD